MADLAEFCERQCPVCTRARRGNKLARLIQKIELAVTRGGCPAGKARRARYGVPPDEVVPEIPVQG